jgi:hypothetical protein
MGQPIADYHIIPIDMESIWDNQVWTIGMSRLIGTADKSADIWRFQNNL